MAQEWAPIPESDSDIEQRCCDGCGDINPEHWREGGWYCDGCAACPQCDSPYCEAPSHD